MRGLNLLKKAKPDKSYWRDIQKNQIDEFNQTDTVLQPAFAGSYVFNHILVPAIDNDSCRQSPLIPDVSGIVYANCSNVIRECGFENYIVIDVDDVDDLSLVDVIAELVDKSPATRVVFAGIEAFDIFAEVLKEKAGTDIQLHRVEPDWGDAVTLHNLYRQAESVIFVNSMRALDAAYTGCDSVLITDAAFCSSPGFADLQKLLTQAGCEVLDESGRIRQISKSSNNASYRVVDNSVSAVNVALQHSNTAQNPANTDWLPDYMNPVSDPVIKCSPVRTGNAFSLLRDRTTGVSRKVAKLRDDPRAFFADSNNAALRLVARTVWAKSAEG